MPYDPRKIRAVDRVRLYPSASADPDAAIARSWDITITGAGAEGDEWDLEFNGDSVQFVSLAGPDANSVAAGLRAAAAALVGVTVTGATSHVIVTVPAVNGPEDQPASAPVLTTDGAGTSSQAVVSASSTSGFGVTTVDMK